MANGDGLFTDFSVDPGGSSPWPGDGFADNGGAFSTGGDFSTGIVQVGLWDQILQGARGMFGGGTETRLGSIAKRVGTGITGMGTSLALRFPRLAAAIARWRGAGVAVTPAKLWTLVRRFGPQFLIAAGILSLEELTELMLHQATHKRRRMNVLNPRALSRSTRRLCGFERRAARVSETLRGLAGVARGRGRSKSRSRCAICHRNPCRCS